MPLIINSPIAAIRKHKETVTLHFIAFDADGNQRMDIVHPNEDFNASQCRVGQQVIISVTPVSFDKKTGEVEFVMLEDMAEHQFVTHGSGIGAGMSRQ